MCHHRKTILLWLANGIVLSHLFLSGKENMSRSNGRKEKDGFDVILKIDKFNLDEEWIKQPNLFFKSARRLANARLAVDEAKAELNLTKAELESAIRTDPIGYDLGKVTEKSVEACVLMQSEYSLAIDKWHKAKHLANIEQAKVNALEQRKDALQDIVKLQGRDYFSTPIVPEESREYVQDVVRRKVRRKGAKHD